MRLNKNQIKKALFLFRINKSQPITFKLMKLFSRLTIWKLLVHTMKSEPNFWKRPQILEMRKIRSQTTCASRKFSALRTSRGCTERSSSSRTWSGRCVVSQYPIFNRKTLSLKNKSNSYKKDNASRHKRQTYTRKKYNESVIYIS